MFADSTTCWPSRVVEAVSRRSANPAVQPDDGREAQRARHDRGVRRAAAHVRAERQDELPVEHRGVRRRQVVGEQDVRVIDLRQRGRLPAGEVHHHAAGHVVHIQAAFAQIGIVHLFEEAGVAVGHLLEDGLDVAPVVLERAQDLVDERAILDDQQMRVEDAGVLGPDGVGDLRLHVEDLRAREQQRGLEPGDLRREVLLADRVLGRGVLLRAVDEHLSPRQTRRHP